MDRTLEASKEATMEPPVLHLTRGTFNPKTLDQARTMHNAFVAQGPQPGTRSPVRSAT